MTLATDRAADDTPPPVRPRSKHDLLAAILCAILALAASVHAYLAASAKSATFDEPAHVLSAWLITHRGDFRVNPEHPALWKYLAALPLAGTDLKIDLASTAALAPLDQIEQQWPLAVDTLYRTRGNDGIALVNRARLAMSILPALIVVASARWAFLLAGPAAAVVAAVVLAFDPTLLAHGALVTNDAAAALAIVGSSLLAWRLGERFTWPRAAGLAVALGLSIGAKASCVLLWPMLATAGLIGVIRRPDRGRWLARGTIVLAAGGVAAIALLWPSYQFRAAPTRDGRRFDSGYVAKLERYEFARRGMPGRSGDELRGAAETLANSSGERALAWVESHNLLPQAFAWGVRYARVRAMARPAFFLGEVRPTGSPWYFPVAIAVKEPLATLALVAAAGIVALAAIARRPRVPRWRFVALVVPPAVYLAAAMTANLNIGVRHVLPVLPFAAIGAGVAAASAIRRSRRARIAVGVALLALFAETTAAFPDDLAFFNLAAGGPRGGLRLLGDSNLDWGQDLPALAEYYRGWRRANPGAPFYLSYFGSAEPRAYGIDYVNAVPGYPLARSPPSDAFAREGGTLAIGASALQGLVDRARDPMLRALRDAPPLDVIGGTIYIYRVAPAATGPNGR